MSRLVEMIVGHEHLQSWHTWAVRLQWPVRIFDERNVPRFRMSGDDTGCYNRLDYGIVRKLIAQLDFGQDVTVPPLSWRT